MSKKRILIKISGASLKESQDSLYSKTKILDFCTQIKKLSSKYAITIIVGGGNIWRGSMGAELDMNQNLADNMGMIATIMNALALSECFNNKKLKTKVLSSHKIEGLCDLYSFSAANEILDNNNILILAGGTGNSYFTTDTTAALRAAQLDIKLILMGKNGVDGVYTKDPNKYKDSKFIKKASYDEAINQKLDVMDTTALTLCKENNIELNVFNLNKKNSIIDTLENKIKYTIIK